VPASCLGKVPALAAEFSGIPLIAVRENKAVLHVTNDKMRMGNVIEVNSYLEAAGIILALRNGISLESVRKPLQCARRIDLPHPETMGIENIPGPFGQKTGMAR